MSRLFAKRIGVVAGCFGALIAGYELFARPWAARWGATDAELGRKWPGDDLVAEPTGYVTHAITIHAPASAIWPWIMQIGQDRAGYYSYTPLENLFGAQMHNTYRIVPEFQSRNVGDDVWMAPKNKFGGQARLRVAMLETNRAMVLVPPVDSDKVQNGADSGMVWALLLDPIDADNTRLVTRIFAPRNPKFSQRILAHVFWEPAHFIMERKMMRTIKRLAEGSAV